MPSIHELSAIIEQLELRVNNFKTPNPTDKQKASLEAQGRLIKQLQSIYDQYQHMNLYDIFIEVQSEYDKMREKDAELHGVVIRIPFKEKADIRKYGFINFTL